MFWVLSVVCSLSVLVTRCQEVTTKDGNLKNDNNTILEFFNNCKCVFHYQCDDRGFIITNGKGLIDNRIGVENGESKPRITCDGGLFQGELVCCKLSSNETIQPTTSTTTSTTTPTTTSTSTTTPTTISTSTTTKPKKRKIKCGKTRSSINVRISAGDDNMTPLDGEFPWLAAIYKRNANNGQWKYNKIGSLIHPKVVLTAAHVVGRSKPNDLKIIVNGQIKLSQIGDNESQERDVEEIIKHSEFSSGSLYNDIALIILQKPYDINNTLFVNTICLRPEISYENKRCYLAGWGQNSIQSGASEILKKVDVPTHLPGKCQEMLRKTRLGLRYIFHKSHMCAGGEEGKSSCTGDGGSPLVCFSEELAAMYQVGIVAYGIGCGIKDYPDVYANVLHFHDWITAKLNERNINI